MPERNIAAGMAALTITETTLLLMIEKGLLKPEDIGLALEDTAQIHREAAGNSACSVTGAAHAAAARLIENIVRGSNLQAAARPVPAAD